MDHRTAGLFTPRYHGAPESEAEMFDRMSLELGMRKRAARRQARRARLRKLLPGAD